jgi:hypothetical protein
VLIDHGFNSRAVWLRLVDINQTQNGAFLYKKYKKTRSPSWLGNGCCLLPWPWPLGFAAWFLASCRAIMMVGHSKKERKRREGEEIKPPTPCLRQAPASAPQKSFLSGELVTFYLPLL